MSDLLQVQDTMPFVKLQTPVSLTCTLYMYSSALFLFLHKLSTSFHSYIVCRDVPVKYMYICWQLLSNQNFKGPYLKAEVVEEIMGWLG